MACAALPTLPVQPLTLYAADGGTTFRPSRGGAVSKGIMDEVGFGAAVATPKVLWDDTPTSGGHWDSTMLQFGHVDREQLFGISPKAVEGTTASMVFQFVAQADEFVAMCETVTTETLVESFAPPPMPMPDSMYPSLLADFSTPSDESWWHDVIEDNQFQNNFTDANLLMNAPSLDMSMETLREQFPSPEFVPRGLCHVGQASFAQIETGITYRQAGPNLQESVPKNMWSQVNQEPFVRVAGNSSNPSLGPTLHEKTSTRMKTHKAYPSDGSRLHEIGKCNPCAWFWKSSGCQNAEKCEYCHLCPKDELKNRKKAKVAAIRMGALKPGASSARGARELFTDLHLNSLIE